MLRILAFLLYPFFRVFIYIKRKQVPSIEDEDEDDECSCGNDCMIMFSVNEDSNLIIRFHISPDREEQFVHLLHKLHSGNLRDMVDECILEFGQKSGQGEYATSIIEGIDRHFAISSYNGEVLELDDEDPLVCPTEVFRSNDTD